jgi:hypothetical protein
MKISASVVLPVSIRRLDGAEATFIRAISGSFQRPPVLAALLTGYRHGNADEKSANACKNPRLPLALIASSFSIISRVGSIEYGMDKGGIDVKRHSFSPLSEGYDWCRCLSRGQSTSFNQFMSLHHVLFFLFSIVIFEIVRF